MAKSLLADPYM